MNQNPSPKGAQYHHIQDFDITAVQETGFGGFYHERPEPPNKFNPGEEMFDVQDLRRQLGAPAAPLSLRTRGLLALSSVDSIRAVVDESSDQWKEYCASAPEIERDGVRSWDPNIYKRSTYSWVKEMALSNTQPIALCTGNCIVNETAVRSGRVLAWMLDETIQETGSPALAMRAVLTQLLREAYYTWLLTMDHTSQLEVAAVERVSAPRASIGFWAVATFVFMHLLGCLMTFWMFADSTERGFLGNAWQMAAEVLDHKDVKEVMEKANQLKYADKVEKWIEKDLRKRKPSGGDSEVQ